MSSGTEREAQLPRPPRRCTPEQFYGEYVPQLWDELAGRDGWPSYSYELGFSLGAPLGEHTMRWDAGTMSGRTGAAEEPAMTISCDESAWKLAVHDLMPRVIRRVNKKLDEARRNFRRFAEKRAASLHPSEFAAMGGQVEVDFTDDAGDRGTYRLAVGNGSGASARIEATEDDLWALMDSKSLVSFLKSRAQLHGDVAYVIKLARYFEG